MNSSELRTLSEAALQDKLKELHQESFNLRFQHATAQLDNTARIRQVRRNVARVMTVLGERTADKQES
ncbi:MAG: 50S ribosomal protein L29 [Magnetococcales bacterium]|nr:50S ribosomal protein L29 [Magnetococcales bacterium]